MQENEFTKRHLMVAQNASGRSLNVPIYHFKGRQPGPKVYIQSSIHGSEVQGNVVIYHLIQMLSQLPIAGEVTLVPNCNPVGTNIKAGEYTLGRFDPVNGPIGIEVIIILMTMLTILLTELSPIYQPIISNRNSNSSLPKKLKKNCLNHGA